MSEKKIFIWAGTAFKGEPKKCYEELMKLGDYTAEMVVRYARSHPESELFKCFDWNDTTAAEKWRLHTARQISCSLSVKYPMTKGDKTEMKEIRLFQNIPAFKAYSPTLVVVRDEDAYADLLRQAKADLARFKERYKTLSELSELIDDIDRYIG